MQNYEISVTETLGTYFVIQANSREEAEQLFSDWSSTESGIMWISDRLNDSSNGWEFSEAVPTLEGADVTYEEAKKEINK